MSDTDFTGKAVIVTGSSSGIGRATAILFASKGASVTVCGRSAESLETVMTLCKEASPPNAEARFHSVQGDLKDSAVPARIVDETVSHLGRLDIVVANAAEISGLGTVEGTTEEDLDASLHINVRSVFFLIQRAVPHLAMTKGNVVVVSSPASTHTCPGMIPYSVSKAALDHLVRNFAVELGPKGIRVNVVLPGVVATNILRHVNDKEIEARFFQSVVPSVPLGRAGTPDDVARPIAFLASSQADYVTGSSLHVGGGLNVTPVKYDYSGSG